MSQRNLLNTTAVWQATYRKEDIPLFDETRRSLLDTYHSYAQNHVGYAIGFVLGFLALFASNPLWYWYLSAFPLGFGIFYSLLRIQYWTSYASVAISISQRRAIELFNISQRENKERNLNLDHELPFTKILQRAIADTLEIDAKYKAFLKFVLWCHF